MTERDRTNGADHSPLAEARLAGLLELLRDEPPPANGRLTDSVMRTARWQYATRGTLVALTELAGVAINGLAMLIGVRADLEGGRAPTEAGASNGEPGSSAEPRGEGSP